MPSDTCSAGDLAKLFAINVRTVQALAAKGLLVKTGHGRYERTESIRSYVIHLREMAAGRTGLDPNGPDVIAENAFMKHEQALLARARRQILERDVIAVSRIQPIWERHARVVRASVLAIPSRARAALPHLSAFDQNKLDDIVRDSLTDLPQKAPPIEAGLGEALCHDDDEPRLAKRVRR